MELTVHTVNATPTSTPAALRAWAGKHTHAYQFAQAGDVWWVRKISGGRSALGPLTDVIFRWDLGQAVYCGEVAPGDDPWAHVRSAVARNMTAG